MPETQNLREVIQVTLQRDQHSEHTIGEVGALTRVVLWISVAPWFAPRIQPWPDAQVEVMDGPGALMKPTVIFCIGLTTAISSEISLR